MTLRFRFENYGKKSLHLIKFYVKLYFTLLLDFVYYSEIYAFYLQMKGITYE